MLPDSMIGDHRLEITLFQPFREFEGMPEPQRARAFDRAERNFDLMGELGTDLMLIGSNVSPLALGLKFKTPISRLGQSGDNLLRLQS